jgi:hypothetical protein
MKEKKNENGDKQKKMKKEENGKMVNYKKHSSTDRK